MSSVKSVLSQAVSTNRISAATAEMMEEQLDEIAQAGCAGIDIDDLDSEENTLVSVCIDASGSMWNFRQAVIDAYNQKFLAPLQKARNAKSILVSTWLFSGEGKNACRLLHGYTPIPQCQQLTNQSYNPNGSTPLYEAVQKSFIGIVSYGQTLIQAGSRVKHIIVVLSDGEENSSNRSITATKLKKQANDLLKTEQFVLSYIFFGPETQGDSIANTIGFPSHHRNKAGLTDSEIRRIFGEVSASVITTSQSRIASVSANAFFVNP
jgi:Mg-chelatase subunit ChlD